MGVLFRLSPVRTTILSLKLPGQCHLKQIWLCKDTLLFFPLQNQIVTISNDILPGDNPNKILLIIHHRDKVLIQRLIN